MSEDAVAEGAVWLEPAVWIGPATVMRMGFSSAEEMLRFLLETTAAAEQKHGVGIGFMMATSRIHPPEDAAELARLAARYAGRGVVSFGLAGDEAAGPAELFSEAFRIARAGGLKSTPHAGEHGGSDSVRAALDVLGAQRIEHGVRAIEDPALVQRLVDEGICLDVCPTSNVQLNVCSSLDVHPLPALLEAGVKVSLNADDPVIFGCTLLDEYELARREFGFSDATLAEIAATSIRESGAPDSLRTIALARIAAWLDT
jgi:adenosine deaminase